MIIISRNINNVIKLISDSFQPITTFNNGVKQKIGEYLNNLVTIVFVKRVLKIIGGFGHFYTVR